MTQSQSDAWLLDSLKVGHPFSLSGCRKGRCNELGLSLLWAFVLRLALILCMILAAGRVGADEGMWLPAFLPDSLLTYMNEMGFQFSRDLIFNSEGTGLANAVVRVGATGSFVSPDGLILTNHHVAFSAIQRISTPENNYIERGFLARQRAQEVPAPGYVVYVPKETRDVTDRILSRVSDEKDPLERYYAIERIIKEIIAEAEAETGYHCEIDAFYGGGKYLLSVYEEIPDVRVVYVPARAIGEYGGEIDNWMWPRHAGDFSFLRAYVGPDGKPREYSDQNVPYHPKSYLRVCPKGLSQGDFAMIIGFPRSTNRYLTSHGLRFYESHLYPERVRLLRKSIDLLEDFSARNEDLRVRLAAVLKGLYNRIKNNTGMMEGFRQFNLVGVQSDYEAKLKDRFAKSPDFKVRYEDLLSDFARLYDERARTLRRDLLLEQLLDGWNLFSQAMLIYKMSLEARKPDMERDPRFMQRNVDDLKRFLIVFQASYRRESDKAMVKMLIEELLSLPREQQIGALARRFAKLNPKARTGAIEGFLDWLYRNTSLETVEGRLRLFDKASHGLIEGKDVMIDFVAEMFQINEERIQSERRFVGMLSRLEPEWIKLTKGDSLELLYPDANGTMRINCGFVQGYSPRDAVYYHPFTTLRGVLEKHTGEDPFVCPKGLIEAAKRSSQSRFFWAQLGDVPVDLLTTNDSTGGNSGSPLINSKGDLVGCLFDGNYEAMVSDFRFLPEITRSISVDVRYILFVAENVDSAYNVLDELGVR